MQLDNDLNQSIGSLNQFIEMNGVPQIDYVIKFACLTELKVDEYIKVFQF